MKNSTFFVEGATTINPPARSFVTNVFHTNKAVYFRTADNVSLCLTCEGEKGWRLQAHTREDADFSRLGAAQSLAKFMGEDYSDTAEELALYLRNVNPASLMCFLATV